MTTQELVNMDLVAFAAAVKGLDAGTCSRCARDLFHRLASAATFEQYFADVLGVILCSGQSGEERFVELCQVAGRYAPGVAPGYGVLARLTALTVQMVNLSLSSRTGRR
ncbi:MAG TPA: hypothetical protein VLI39_08775 [Sedimentisphaerales bacterium]|nr:hypothetical protein [Sedimentisphaerales bacterium]